MAKSEVMTGDQIAAQIKTRDANSNFADVAREIHDMMDHTKPGASAAAMAKINEAFHAKGILPGVQITGVQGEDFVGTVTSDKGEGNTVRVDATDVGRQKWDQTTNKTQINGRDATISGDGSGFVTVKPGDNPSFIARDVLKSQGNPNPTPREIAMYELKMEALNGTDIAKHLHPGDVLKLPPALKDSVDGVNDSSFVTERAKDNTEVANAEKTDAQINSDHDAVWAAFKKNGTWNGYFGGGFNITKEQLDKFLAPGKQLTPQEQQGFQFMKDNWDKIAVGGKIWENDVNTYTNRALQAND